LNLLEEEGVSCRRGAQLQMLNERVLGSEGLGCETDLTRAFVLGILCNVYGEILDYDVFCYVKLMKDRVDGC